MVKPFYWNHVTRNIILRAANSSQKVAINDINCDFHKLWVVAQQQIFLPINFFDSQILKNVHLIFQNLIWKTNDHFFNVF